MNDLISTYKIPMYLPANKVNKKTALQELHENILSSKFHDFDGDGVEELYVIYQLLDLLTDKNDEQYQAADCLYIKNKNRWEITDIFFSTNNPGYIVENPASFFLAYETDKCWIYTGLLSLFYI